MGYSKFKNVKVSGISFIIPNIKKNIDDDIHFFNNNENKLKRAKKIIGYGHRYYSPSNVTATDLAEAAAKDLIKNMNVNLEDIDAIIFSSSMQDYFAPASSFILHNRLGLKNSCMAFDIPHGCPAYIYAMHTGSALIESGACRKILIISGDTETEEKRSNNKSLKLLGSGASCATLLEYSEEETISHYYLGSNGSGIESIMIPAGGARMPVTAEILDEKIYDTLGQEWQLNKTYMDGIDVFSFTNLIAPSLITNILSESNHSIDDIEFFALHQANKQITSEIAYKINIPDNKFSTETFTKYGNQMCVSSIGNLVDIWGERLNNQIIKTVIATYGIGYSWGAMLLDIGKIYCSGVKIVNFNNYKSTEEYYTEFVKKIKTI